MGCDSNQNDFVLVGFCEGKRYRTIKKGYGRREGVFLPYGKYTHVLQYLQGGYVDHDLGQNWQPFSVSHCLRVVKSGRACSTRRQKSALWRGSWRWTSSWTTT